MFTAEHYNKIAEIFRGCVPKERMGQLVKQHLVDHLTTMFEKDNPKFVPMKFISACYDEGEE